jgi:hypothetical protein
MHMISPRFGTYTVREHGDGAVSFHARRWPSALPVLALKLLVGWAMVAYPVSWMATWLWANVPVLHSRALMLLSMLSSVQYASSMNAWVVGMAVVPALLGLHIINKHRRCRPVLVTGLSPVAVTTPCKSTVLLGDIHSVDTSNFWHRVLRSEWTPRFNAGSSTMVYGAPESLGGVAVTSASVGMAVSKLGGVLAAVVGRLLLLGYAKVRQHVGYEVHLTDSSGNSYQLARGLTRKQAKALENEVMDRAADHVVTAQRASFI